MNRALSSLTKRAVDLAVATPLVLLSLPILAVAWVLLAASIGRPVVFRQPRPGLGGRIFTVFKLRTMTDELGPDGALLADEQRLTNWGRRLRAASIDELPQLMNVLLGDMSLVGPRPLLVRYLPRYSAQQARRHDVRPGITGWAQVHGRNALSWERRFELDVWYVDNWSVGLDLKILAMTVAKVLRRSGIAEQGQATMSEFMGSATQPEATSITLKSP